MEAIDEEVQNLAGFGSPKGWVFRFFSVHGFYFKHVDLFKARKR
jgi:hypothetical protein